MARRGRPKHPDILTPREWQVLDALRLGLSNAEIAEHLGISVEGVKYHVSEILSKLDVTTRDEAARWQPERVRRWWQAAAPIWFGHKVSLASITGGVVATAVVAALAILVWTLLTTEARMPSSLMLPAGDILAFQHEGRIWVLDSSAMSRKLTSDGYSNASPNFSPDRLWVAYSSNHVCPPGGMCPFSVSPLWLSRADGTQAHQSDAGNPNVGPEVDWSPDSQQIVYPVNGALWISRPDGSEPRMLVDDTGGEHPSWSPDGRTIAFGRHLDGLWMMDPGEGTPEQLVTRLEIESLVLARGLDYPAKGIGGTIVSRNVRSIEWSADGQQVAFVVEALDPRKAPPDVGELLFTVRRDGTGLALWGYALGGFAWSPDGARLAFSTSDVLTRASADDVLASPSGIAIAEPGRSTTVHMVTHPADRTDLRPQWSLDGRRIVFEAVGERPTTPPGTTPRWEEGSQEGVWIVDADGSNLVHIAAARGFIERSPRWTSDGEVILFLRRKSTDVNASLQFWLMRPDGSEQMRLASGLAEDTTSRYPVDGWDWYQAPVSSDPSS